MKKIIILRFAEVLKIFTSSVLSVLNGYFKVNFR